jgi:dTDP-4-amino-4,6-dideoxygalactose transaminase
MKKIKFLNIYESDKKIVPFLLRKINKNIINNEFILDKDVKKFEEKYKIFFGSKYAVSCGNGSDALYLAIKTLKLKPKSEIIVPAMTYAATANAVINAGHQVKLVDVLQNGCIDLDSVKENYNKNIKACIIVNLYGQPCNNKNLTQFLKNKKIKIIEDCAQSHGAMDCLNCKNFLQNEKKSCCFKKIYYSKISELSCYSFFPGKNLGCYGDGGMILTDKRKYYQYLKKLRNNGAEYKYRHDIIGINSRLDNIQATILNKKINYLIKNNKKRNQIAKYYLKNINNNKIKVLKHIPGSAYHLFLIYVRQRNRLIKYLSNNKIPFGIHYPKAINKQKSFKKFLKNKFKSADYIANNSLSIPMCPTIDNIQLKKIVKILNNFN